MFVAALAVPFTDIFRLTKILEGLKKFRQEAEFSEFLTVIKRVENTYLYSFTT